MDNTIFLNALNRRLNSIEEHSRLSGIDFIEEEGVYLARAVSSVPDNEKEKLELIFQNIIRSVEKAGLEAKLPVELKDIDPNKINPSNHELLINSRIELPLVYATSDGRGWEMGFSYEKKLIIPLLLPDQKINTPTIRLPYQIPVVLDHNSSEAPPEQLTELLKELSQYEIAFGKLDNKQTVIGRKDGKLYDLRKTAEEFMKVIPYRF